VEKCHHLYSIITTTAAKLSRTNTALLGIETYGINDSISLLLVLVIKCTVYTKPTRIHNPQPKQTFMYCQIQKLRAKHPQSGFKAIIYLLLNHHPILQQKQRVTCRE
jgi:hypothetical protein